MEDPSMFRRHAIVSSADQRDAMEKLEADRAKTDKLDRERVENSPVLKPLYFVSHCGRVAQTDRASDF